SNQSMSPRPPEMDRSRRRAETYRGQQGRSMAGGLQECHHENTKRRKHEKSQKKQQACERLRPLPAPARERQSWEGLLSEVSPVGPTRKNAPGGTACVKQSREPV